MSGKSRFSRISQNPVILKIRDTTFVRETLTGSTLSILVALGAICVVFTILAPNFLRISNFKVIAVAAAFTGVMAAGVTVAMLMAGLDLSQLAVAALSSVLLAQFIVDMSLPLAVAIPLILILGIVCGMFNGLLIAVFRIPAMIATMGTQYVIRGIAYAITSSKSMSFKNEFLRVLGRNFTLGIPNSFIVMAAVFLILSYVLNRTTYGRQVYSVGSNRYASYLAGINPVRVELIAYMIAGLSSAMAGIVMSGQLGASVPSLGSGSEMEIIAAVYLGGVATSGGRGSLFGTLLGVLIICVINNGLVHLGVQSYWTTIVRGAVIIIAVYVDTIRKQREDAAR